jgi:hypothetical protein
MVVTCAARFAQLPARHNFLFRHSIFPHGFFSFVTTAGRRGFNPVRVLHQRFGARFKPTEFPLEPLLQRRALPAQLRDGEACAGPNKIERNTRKTAANVNDINVMVDKIVQLGYGASLLLQ